MDFIHRTFQDYLAARAAVQEGDLGLLVRNAHDDQWEDVIRMSVWHASPAVRADLLSRLLRQARLDSEESARLVILAMTCLEYAVELSPAMQTQVEDEAARLLPPRDMEAADRLARAGSAILELLPGPDGLDRPTARAVVQAAIQTADPRAIPLLARYADHPDGPLRLTLANAWARFDTVEYGRQVIVRLQSDDPLSISAPDQVDFIGSAGGHRSIRHAGPLSRTEIEKYGELQLAHLELDQQWGEADLSALSGCSALRFLSLQVHKADLWPLSGLGLEALHLVSGRYRSLYALADMARLTSLVLPTDGVIDQDRLSALPASLRRLRLRLMDVGRPFTGLLRFTELEHLELNISAPSKASLAPLADLPRLHTLVLDDENLALLDSAPVLPSVRHLVLYRPQEVAEFRFLVRCYPELESLVLRGIADQSLDLAQLAPLRRLRHVEVRSGHPELVRGQEHLAGVDVDIAWRPYSWARAALYQPKTLL
ncbi:hypothetical protein ABUW04_06055 [Streptacidiphilus sp. N1-10]|uniref:Leucine-rich repeat domain-containing protein n=1 Tax=Streptacidiphilus jeojiensis TaxID=3229225 RepID=A0ABV6XIC3_9ACTN